MKITIGILFNIYNAYCAAQPPQRSSPIKVIFGVASTFLTIGGTVEVADLTTGLATTVGPVRSELLPDDECMRLAVLLLDELLDATTVGCVDGIGLPSFVCSLRT